MRRPCYLRTDTDRLLGLLQHSNLPRPKGGSALGTPLDRL